MTSGGRERPAVGAPCTRCGACCETRPCVIGNHLFGPGAPCPALRRTGETTACGVIEDPARYGVEAHLAHCMRSALTGRCDFEK